MWNGIRSAHLSLPVFYESRLCVCGQLSAFADQEKASGDLFSLLPQMVSNMNESQQSFDVAPSEGPGGAAEI